MINKRVLYLVAFLLILVFSCNPISENGDNYRIIKQKQGVKLKIDSIFIKIDSLAPQGYSLFDYNKKDGVYIGYNSTIRSLDLYSIIDTTFLFRVYLEEEGPNQIPGFITNIIYKNNQEVALITQNHFYEFNYKSNEVKAKEINKSSLLMYGGYHTQLIYNSIKNKYYITNTDYNISNTLNPKKYYSRANILSEYDFESNTSKLLNIDYPDIYQENYYGFNDIISISLDEESQSLGVGFAALPGFVFYDLNTFLKVNYLFSDDLVKDLNILPMNFNESNSVEKKFKNRILTASYGVIISLQNYYVLTVNGKMPESATIDFMNNQKLKESYVLIIDKDDFSASKIQVPQTGLFSIFGEENTFYIAADSKEDELKFYKLKINEE